MAGAVLSLSVCLSRERYRRGPMSPVTDGVPFLSTAPASSAWDKEKGKKIFISLSYFLYIYIRIVYVFVCAPIMCSFLSRRHLYIFCRSFSSRWPFVKIVFLVRADDYRHAPST